MPGRHAKGPVLSCREGSLSLDGSAQAGQRLAQILVHDLRHSLGDAGRDGRIGRRRRAGFSLRRNGAWRSEMRPIACQPKNRLTRSNTTADRCWISRAAGPSTRSTRVAGSGGASVGVFWARGQLIFIGSLWVAISGPAMSAQRAMISDEAKPCVFSASVMVVAIKSESGRGKLRAGLLIKGVLVASSPR